MMSRTRASRWIVRAAVAAVTAVLLTVGLAGVAAAREAGPATMTPASRYAVAASSFPVGTGNSNPYSPAYRHPYRHGVLPTIGRQRLMRSWAARQPVSAQPQPSENVTYGGGFNGPAVTTGHEKVYLVFWGSQWGQQSTASNGDVALSGDPSGTAPYLQQLFKGLGTGGEAWSGVMTQYCGDVAYNTEFCPANSLHVSYPSGGALAGVWVDERTAAPVQATGNQLGAEAIAATAHFGNTTAASNRNAQYVILSPTGTNPDGFNTPNGQFCAWHDDSSDPDLPGGPVNSPLDVAFTNMPYVTDAGLGCGMNFVNPGSAGLVDGVSIVEGHEYAETVTDQYPPAGWTDVQGAEVGDLCAWNPPGPGGTNDLALPSGAFAMQSIYGNDLGGGAGGCEFSHPTARNNWILNSGFETGTFAHWTTSGVTSIVSAGAHSGKFAARAGRPTASNGNSSIVQTFTARGTHLSFWYNVSCPDTVAQSWATATLTDITAHTVATVLAKTCQAHSGWRQVSYLVISGHSYTLTLTSHDDNDTKAGDGTYTLFDDAANY